MHGAVRELKDQHLEPKILETGGEVLKRMGDGWIFAFNSVTAALQGSMQVQETLYAHPVIKLRMGLHIGEIVEDESDFYGAGVNLAARLHTEAPPGGVMISQDLPDRGAGASGRHSGLNQGAQFKYPPPTRTPASDFRVSPAQGTPTSPRNRETPKKSARHTQRRKPPEFPHSLSPRRTSDLRRHWLHIYPLYDNGGSKLELLYLAGSPFSRIPRILILEWQLDVATREVGFPVPADIEDVNPLGQAPVLLRPPKRPLFLTLNIIEELASIAGSDLPFPYRAIDRADTAIALSAGDSVVAAAQAQWSGLGKVSEDRLGWNPMERNLDRFNRTMDWLAERTSLDSFVALVVAAIMYWAKDRPVEGVITDGKAAQHFLSITARPSFEVTKPPPIEL